MNCPKCGSEDVKGEGLKTVTLLAVWILIFVSPLIVSSGVFIIMLGFTIAYTPAYFIFDIFTEKSIILRP